MGYLKERMKVIVLYNFNKIFIFTYKLKILRGITERKKYLIFFCGGRGVKKVLMRVDCQEKNFLEGYLIQNALFST